MNPSAGYIFRVKRLEIIKVVWLAFFHSVFTALSVSALLPFLNVVFMGRLIWPEGMGPELNLSRTELLVYICAGTLTVFVLKNIFFVMLQGTLSHYRHRMTEQLRQKGIRNLLGRGMPYFHTIRSARPVTQLTDTVQRMADLQTDIIAHASRYIPLIMIYVFLLFWLHWLLTIGCLLLIPVMGLAGYAFHGAVEKLSRRQQVALTEFVHDIQQKLLNIKLIKIFHSERYESERHDQQSAGVREAHLAKDRLANFSIAVLEIAGVAMGVMLLYIVGAEAAAGQFAYGPGGLVLFIAVVFSLIDPVRHLIKSFQDRREIRVYMKQINELLEEPAIPASKAVFGIKTPEPLTWNDVTFRYQPGLPDIFSGAHVTLHRGQVTGLTGKSGSGKSTFVDLCAGLMAPTSGAITIGGIHVSALDPSLRPQVFGVLTQEPYIFNDTLRNNVRYNLSDIPDGRILEVLEQTKLSAWLTTLPDGLDTPLGERGCRMSGGEKQRLALARLCLRHPAYLFCDEATSALDPDMEQTILKTVIEVFKDSAIVLISHRWTVLNNASRLLEIRDGIIESVR